MTLDNILGDADYEQRVIENLRYSKNIMGTNFKVIFWNRSVPSLRVKEFVSRNDYILCDINTDITKSFDPIWFLITDGDDLSRWRYKYIGDPLLGISQYVSLIKHIIKMENNESRNSR